VPEVFLIPLTDDERESFLHEEVSDYADQQIRDADWPPDEALDRAGAEITPVFDRELAEAVASHDRLWSAKTPGGKSVGWLWVKPSEGTSAPSVFLEQITVAASCRRRGYGHAMLEALEKLLAADGVQELRLNVFVGNQAARGLYSRAGYEEVDSDERRVSLRKELHPSGNRSN
jgi:ribosomal protein S18 acetylase RimI-like enzyme